MTTDSVLRLRGRGTHDGAVVMGLVLVAMLIGLNPGTGQAEPTDRIALVIVNQATEAARRTVEESRCIDGAATLNGRLLLIEQPRFSTTLRILTDHACAVNRSARLRILLNDLAGGIVGTLVLKVDEPNIALFVEGATQANICASSDRADRAPAAVFTARFRPCDS